MFPVKFTVKTSSAELGKGNILALKGGTAWNQYDEVDTYKFVCGCDVSLP